MLSAADRVILRAAKGDFISEQDLNPTQRRGALDLEARGLLQPAGRETDGSQVWRITQKGRTAYGARL